MPKQQRIRDPLHNLIEFGSSHEEQVLWKIIQTPEFQRLRRIKQLGFSDFVYPGATHTRFSHSLGVYHTAKQLLDVVKRKLGKSFNPTLGDHVLAAALLHDVGHGPFSHAFEAIGKKFNWVMANHEEVSDKIIRDRERDICKILDNEYEGLSTIVANLIKAPTPQKIYGAIVSSQFDADRLDYIQRDRLMTGTRLGGIDFSWLTANLEIEDFPSGIADVHFGPSQTFVLNHKAIHAAESYILALFQLYPTVYFHKTTRGIEKLFVELFSILHKLIQSGDVQKTNLPESHPLVQFFKRPIALSNALALDDTVVLGSLFLMRDAKDSVIAELASRIIDRKLYKCIDVYKRIEYSVDPKKRAPETLERIKQNVKKEIYEWCNIKNIGYQVLLDEGKREPYKSAQIEQGPLKQIMIKVGNDIMDIEELSPIVRTIPNFEFFRVYYREGDTDAKKKIEGIIKQKCEETKA